MSPCSAAVALAVGLGGPVTSGLPSPDRQITRWVEQLGHSDFRVRDAATRQLLERGPEAALAVRRATRSADPEVARRAADILRDFDRRFNPLTRMNAAVKNREPDLFAERAVRYAGNEDYVWQAILDFGWVARGVCEDAFHRRFHPVTIDTPRLIAPRKEAGVYRILPSDTHTLTASGGMYLFRGGSITIGERACIPFLASSGAVETSSDMVDFYFVGGRMTVTPTEGALGRSVVMCDGDFEVHIRPNAKDDSILNSMVVAHGDVLCPKTQVVDSVILATGDVRIPEGAKIAKSTIRAGGTIHRPQSCVVKDSDLKDGLADPTAPFKFFELSRVGVEVTAVAGGVRVKKAEGEKPFAAAGVAGGDVIAAVDGKPVESAAGFRKQVRAAVARGDATLTVRRDGKTRDLTVRFPD